MSGYHKNLRAQLALNEEIATARHNDLVNMIKELSHITPPSTSRLDQSSPTHGRQQIDRRKVAVEDRPEKVASSRSSSPGPLPPVVVGDSTGASAAAEFSRSAPGHSEHCLTAHSAATIANHREPPPVPML
ncbi:hypothetical protein HAX54_020156 [Datura stramonium]|uniref:Uncharacterized protein n=1 Tax=Datura stramonium TaxID=4076 RepID=A0ABS8UQP6_DATST|nr:hypothetical protein [Datura stramonium]